MNNFKDFNIETQSRSFVGDKIKAERILNKPIIINDWKIEPSKLEKEKGKDCLHLQLTVDGSKRVIFLDAKYLIEQIKQVPKDKLPFEATIILNNNRLEFT